mmetsp:Transcript_45866/g.146396  ORF Transcript_45866/g.146396 Transcript_45866/m.146396 type:complete len:211 (-) Transcript_45866:1183-1815(-)
MDRKPARRTGMSAEGDCSSGEDTHTGWAARMRWEDGDARVRRDNRMLLSWRAGGNPPPRPRTPGGCRTRTGWVPSGAAGRAPVPPRPRPPAWRPPAPGLPRLQGTRRLPPPQGPPAPGVSPPRCPPSQHWRGPAPRPTTAAAPAAASGASLAPAAAKALARLGRGRRSTSCRACCAASRRPRTTVGTPRAPCTHRQSRSGEPSARRLSGS